YDKVVRQENIETAPTVTSIIPASTVNSDHNSRIIIAQKNQSEPIFSELINMDIDSTLQKAKNLANRASHNPASSSQEVHRHHYGRRKSVTKGKELKPPQEASVGIYKAIQKAYNNALQHKEYQILADLLKLPEFSPDCEEIPGPSQHLQVTQWIASIDGQEKHDAFNSRMEEKQPSTPKQVPKTAPVARSNNSNANKKP
ncbi:hypothetical protein O181_034519, partial [Austropuccinia psidii MF-1]|nr:hypothetical protein [Austropuccinia psidii MF-1]